MELKNKIINVLGDSITEGYGTSGEAYTYPAVLGRAVGAATVRNYGIGGTCIALQVDPETGEEFDHPFVKRYVHMADDADVVLVLGGVNDYDFGNAPFGTMEDRTIRTFCGACHVLFQGLIEKYPAARIVIMTPLQREGGNRPSENSGLPLIAYADTIAEIAGQYSLPVIDLYRKAGICPDIPCQKEMFYPDGLHPNDAGAARIAAYLEACLKAL